MTLNEIIILLIGIVVTAINTYIGVKIKSRDEDARKYRDERVKKDEERTQKEEETRKLSESSTLALIRVELRENYLECKRIGCYTIEDREVFHQLYSIYKKLGGNGVVDQWENELMNMPTSEKFSHKFMRFIKRQL